VAERFAEGTSVGHPDMPEFVSLEPRQIKDLLAYPTNRRIIDQACLAGHEAICKSLSRIELDASIRRTRPYAAS